MCIHSRVLTEIQRYMHTSSKTSTHTHTHTHTHQLNLHTQQTYPHSPPPSHTHTHQVPKTLLSETQKSPAVSILHPVCLSKPVNKQDMVHLHRHEYYKISF